MSIFRHDNSLTNCFLSDGCLSWPIALSSLRTVWQNFRSGMKYFIHSYIIFEMRILEKWRIVLQNNG